MNCMAMGYTPALLAAKKRLAQVELVVWIGVI